MKLYDSPWAPSPRRVRIYLAEKGIEVERVVVDLRADEQRGEAFRAINPRGVVPALALDSGEVITESSAICRYFEALHPDPPLWGGDDPLAIAWIEGWTRRIEAEGYQAVVAVFRDGATALAGRPLSGTWPEMPQIAAMVDRGRTMWTAFIAALADRLADSEWIAGPGYSYADITALVAIDFGVARKLPDPRERPEIARWHAAMTARPSAAA